MVGWCSMGTFNDPCWGSETDWLTGDLWALSCFQAEKETLQQELRTAQKDAKEAHFVNSIMSIRRSCVVIRPPAPQKMRVATNFSARSGPHSFGRRKRKRKRSTNAWSSCRLPVTIILGHLQMIPATWCESSQAFQQMVMLALGNPVRASG